MSLRSTDEISKRIEGIKNEIDYHEAKVKELRKQLEPLLWVMNEEISQEQPAQPKRTYTRREKPAQPEPPLPDPNDVTV